MRRLRWILVVPLLFGWGCGGSRSDDEPSSPADLATLPGLRAVADPWLRDELARIEEEGGTPEQLTHGEAAPEQNAADALDGLFSERRLGSLLRESERLFPEGEFRFQPIALEKAIDFRRRYDEQRLAAREALKRFRCDFSVRFTEGFSAKLDFIPVVRLLGRLEAFEAAEALADNEPARAVEALCAMLRLAACLDGTGHLDVRLSAALLRSEAFGVLQEIVHRCRTARGEIERLRQAVIEHLERWPDDADAWVGERALGLWSYELVRAGRALDLLAPGEAKQIAEEGGLDQFAAAAARNVDRDERFYLEAMGKVIEASQQSYFTRLDMLSAIREDLQDKRTTAEFPLVAGRLLLRDVWEAQEMQARDRANWEAWSVALSEATGRAAPFEISPLSGKEYLVEKLADDLVVSGFGTEIDGDFPEIRVPLLRK